MKECGAEEGRRTNMKKGEIGERSKKNPTKIWTYVQIIGR